MAIQGLRATDDFTQYRERPENWRMGLLMLEPNGTAPLYALTSMMKSEGSDDPTFNWFEEELPTYRVALNEDLDTTETAITLVSGATYFKAGDVLRVEETEELLMVTANPTIDTEITVSRGFGGSTAAAVTFATDNPYLLLIGSAYEEGSSAPEGRTFSPTEHYNYLQIFRDTFEVTNTARETKYRTGDTVKEDKRRTLTRHSMGIERSLFFGRRSLTIVNGKPRRTTNGIFAQIPSENQFAPASGTTASMAEMEEWLRQTFLFGSNEKMGFAGNRAMLGFQQMVRKNSAYQLAPMSKEYGMNVVRFTTPFGTLVLKTHPQFNQATSPNALGYTALDTWCAILDMTYIKWRYLNGRDTKYEPELQENGVDGLKSGYITEGGLMLSHPKTCAVIKGLAGGKVDA